MRASAFRAAAARWHDLAELALPLDVPEYAELRAGLAAVHESIVARGDAGAADAAEAAARLWDLRARLRAAPPAQLDYAALSAALQEIYETEVAAALLPGG